ncbi:MAG TPA: methyltransferase [Roseiflexaceae bacterium]|nr:methyltransferase [Roseiflexaceae bacterium]
MRNSAAHPVPAAPALTEVRLGDQMLRVPSAAGEPVRPVDRLLAGAVTLAPDARVLVLGGGAGALAVMLARRVSQGKLLLMDAEATDLDLAEQTLRANGIGNATVSRDITLAAGQAVSFDAAVMALPKGRKLARRWLLEAAAALRPDGMLFLAGPNNEGIQPVIGDAGALFGPVTPLGYRERCRIARARKGDMPIPPPWAAEPGVAPGTWRRFSAGVRGVTLELESLPGVFAYDRLDDGTRLLLEHLEIPPGARVLDIGCGYGLIGLWAARSGAAQVDLTDSSLLAAAAARRNLDAHGVHQAQVFTGDALAPVAGRSYDLIVTNPPFHEGRAVTSAAAHRFIQQARAALLPGGRFVLVANRFLPYDQVLRPLFGTVTRLADDRRYHVISSEC